MKLFLDLDGTLIDSRERLHRLFQFLVAPSKLSFDEYWRLKREGISHEQILLNNFGFSTQQINDFTKQWMSMIEMTEWLAFDKPIANVFEHLLRLQKMNSLYLVTARQDAGKVEWQLANFGWSNFFSDVLVTKQETSKKEKIFASVAVTKQDWIIGDTGSDIKAGQELGIRTAGVLSGFLSRKSLLQYRPDLLLESILDFKGE